MRKLQKQRELELAKNAPDHESEDSSDDEGPAPAVKPRVSLFAALGGDGDDHQQEDQDDDQQDENPKEEEEGAPQQPPTEKKSKKKKKKKKTRAAASAVPDTIAEDEDQGGEDEIDKAINELKISSQQRDGEATSEEPLGSARRINELLSINTYHLRAMNEMRNLFGRDVIESANAEEEQETNRRRRGPTHQQVDLETFLRGPPGAKRLPEVSLRRNVFIQGREHWPRQTAGGLTMKQLHKAEDGSFTEYTYIHDKEYDAVQTFFFSCVQIGDPMRIVYLLQQVRKSPMNLREESHLIFGIQRTMYRHFFRSVVWPSRTRTWLWRQNFAKGPSSHLAAWPSRRSARISSRAERAWTSDGRRTDSSGWRASTTSGVSSVKGLIERRWNGQSCSSHSTTGIRMR